MPEIILAFNSSRFNKNKVYHITTRKWAHFQKKKKMGSFILDDKEKGCLLIYLSVVNLSPAIGRERKLDRVRLK